MVPWCGRTAYGHFLNGDVPHQLPVNSPPHAIHGTGRDTAWRTAKAGESQAAFYYDLAEPWPYPGRVTQTFELAEDSLTLAFGVETYGDSFPAQAAGTRGSCGTSEPAATYRSPSTPPGRRSGARTICRPAAGSRPCPARGTTASGCPTGSM